MILEVPDNLLATQLSEQITSIVLKQINERLALINKTITLIYHLHHSNAKRGYHKHSMQSV